MELDTVHVAILLVVHMMHNLDLLEAREDTTDKRRARTETVVKGHLQEMETTRKHTGMGLVDLDPRQATLQDTVDSKAEWAGLLPPATATPQAIQAGLCLQAILVLLEWASTKIHGVRTRSNNPVTTREVTRKTDLRAGVEAMDGTIKSILLLTTPALTRV